MPAASDPGLLVGLAVAVALPGIWLVAGGSDESAGTAPGTDPGSGPGAPVGPRSSGVADGLLAGLGFGAMFSALGQVGDGAGAWSAALTQGVSTVSVVVLAALLGAAWRPTRTALLATPAGPLGGAAVILFLLANQHGLLTVAAVVSSLYPAATILLAVAVLHERVQRAQAVGLLLCGATVVLVSLG